MLLRRPWCKKSLSPWASRILDDHPEILKLAHEDLKRLSSGGRQGREADFTSETILRALTISTPGCAFSQLSKLWGRAVRKQVNPAMSFRVAKDCPVALATAEGPIIYPKHTGSCVLALTAESTADTDLRVACWRPAP